MFAMLILASSRPLHHVFFLVRDVAATRYTVVERDAKHVFFSHILSVPSELAPHRFLQRITSTTKDVVDVIILFTSNENHWRPFSARSLRVMWRTSGGLKQGCKQLLLLFRSSQFVALWVWWRGRDERCASQERTLAEWSSRADVFCSAGNILAGHAFHCAAGFETISTPVRAQFFCLRERDEYCEVCQ